MTKTIHKTSAKGFRRCTSIFILVTFVSSLVAAPVRAQVLPLPGTSVGLTAGFQPPVLMGLKIHPENPLLFDFIVDQGSSKLSEEQLRAETEKLVKYFLAALTIPDKEVWVNLSPYEKDRIIPDVLGQTIMGKTMLEQDYLLKQLASSLTNPDEKMGQEFWSKVKVDVLNKLGNTDVAMNTFNKVWIVPQKAEVLESRGIVLVGEKRLQVMMDEDYVAMEKNTQSAAAKAKDVNTISSAIFKDTILPNIEKEINEGRNFADVRQIYNSVILAAWYKQALKESLLGRVYADKGKVAGVETDDKEMKQKIYEQYLAAFKKGVYNLIKEESDSATGDMIPRKYFSGGIKIAKFVASSALNVRQVSSADLEKSLRAKSAVNTVMVRLAEDREPMVASSSTLFERLNLISIKSGKLFFQMRQQIPQLDISEFKLQDTEIIYQLFKGIYWALTDRLIHEREGRSTEDLVNSRVEMAEVWATAYGANYYTWAGFNAEVRKRSEEILGSVGLNGSREMLPAVKEALISSLTADFINQWKKMNETEDGARASSGAIQVDNEISIRAGQLFTLVLVPQVKELAQDGFTRQEQDAAYYLFTGIYRDLVFSILKGKKDIPDTVRNRNELRDAWFSAMGVTIAFDQLDKAGQQKVLNYLQRVALDGSSELNPVVRDELIKSLSSDFGPNEDEREPTLTRWWNMLNPPGKEIAASSAVDPDQNLGQGQNFAAPEPQFDADQALAEIPGAAEVLDITAGGAFLDISEKLEKTKGLLKDAEVQKYVNAETLRKIIDQIIMIYYFGPRNDRPALFDATGLDNEPSEMKAAAEIAVNVLGFEKAPDDGRGHEGYTPQLYGYKMSNGKWASYDELAAALDLNGFNMPGISSSAVIEKMAQNRAQAVLQSFSATAQEDMKAYVELMAKKGEPVIDVDKNGMAKEFVRVLILNMLQHNFSSFESLSFQNWREISDVLHWIPEQMPSPGDFINQLTVLPADGNLKKILSEREFHEKFTSMVSQAVAEIKQFRNLMQQAKYTIFQMLDSEIDTSWNAIAALKDFVAQKTAVPADSPHFALLLNNRLIDDKGEVSPEVKAALQFFTLPAAQAIVEGARRFKYTASSGVSAAVDRVRQLGLRQTEIVDLPTGTIIILKNLDGSSTYTFVNVKPRPAYKNVVPKFGLLEGDFRNTPIADLDKMIQQQLPPLADNEVQFLGKPPQPELLKDEEGRTIAGITYGRLKLPSEKAYGTGTVIIFANREAVLVPGAFLSVDSAELKIRKIRAVQADFKPHWINLGAHNVFVKYLGLVLIDNQWKELTQFTAFYNNRASRFQRIAGVAYLEGNQARTASFANWEQIKAQQVNVGSAASSALEQQPLTEAENLRLQQLGAKPDLEKYLRGLSEFELTDDAALVLRAPNHENYVTLPQLMIYRNTPPGTMRSANLIRMIANYVTQVALPGEVVTLSAVRKLSGDLGQLLESLASDENARVIVGSKKDELEQVQGRLGDILTYSNRELSIANSEEWFNKQRELVEVLRFEVLMVNEILELTDRVKTGDVGTQVAENKIVEWLRFLPGAAPQKTSRKNISRAMVALTRQALAKDPDFISKLEGRILVNANGRGAIIKHSKFYLAFMERLSALKVQQVPGASTASSAIKKNVGGINFDPTNLNLQIKRDGQGVPLPLPQQNLEQINIQGFFPVIINIQPVNTQTLPVLLGQPLGSPLEQGDPQEKLSFLN